MDSLIVYTTLMLPILQLFSRWSNGRIVLPDHQRMFVWPERKQRKFIESIRQGKPIPSILLRELNDGRMSLEDGHQRTETIRRYMNDMFKDSTGRLYSELTDAEKYRINSYNIPTVQYSGATDEDARRIFNNCQEGTSLTVGERIWSLHQTMPIASYAISMLLTPNEGLYHDIGSLFGNHTARANRGGAMTTAFALCAGVAFGSNYISKKWDDIDEIGHRDFDADKTTQTIRKIIAIFQKVEEATTIASTNTKKKYWDLGNFIGYIIHSIEMFDLGDAMFKGMPYAEFESKWVNYIVLERNNPSALTDTLHRDIDAARSWKVARWANGVRRLFDPVSFNTTPAAEDIEDDSD